MHLLSSLYGSLVPDLDISSQDNGSSEEDWKSPPLDPPNGCRSPGGHILRIHPISSTAALMCFTYWGQAVLAAQGGEPLPMKRKQIADTNYHFAITNILALIWPIFTLMDVLNRKGPKFTMVSSKSSEKYFLGFEEETWLTRNCMGNMSAQMSLSSHPKG